jgi:hypothetical protein
MFIALDGVFAIDQLAHAQHLVVGHLVRPALHRDADLAADLMRLGAADAVDIGQGNRHPLVVRDVDASNSRHLRPPCKQQKWERARPAARARIIRIAGVASIGPLVLPATRFELLGCEFRNIGGR